MKRQITKVLLMSWFMFKIAISFILMIVLGPIGIALDILYWLLQWRLNRGKPLFNYIFGGTK